jgi:hypothetical protein
MLKSAKMQHRDLSDRLDDWSTLDHKCRYENVAHIEHYHLSDYYQLALAGPAVFVSKFLIKM